MRDPQMAWGNAVDGKRYFADIVTISNWLTEVNKKKDHLDEPDLIR